MVDSGTELGADLGKLWLCGRAYLPKIADAFLAGNARADGTATYDGAFSRTGTVGPGYEVSVPGPVQPAWTAARDELQRVMGQTATNIYAASDALIRVTDLYATADGSSAELSREISKFMDGTQLPPGASNYVPVEQPGDRPAVKQPGD
ncbi:hypothetical protein [Actinoplanes sp. NPDC051411]|jgi:hypothetical protein|uniref:hypothetical protein n=1 Tax=Actinoplanes sp. NPDC051411 TaxID=3155522 RepID=UPI00343D70D7